MGIERGGLKTWSALAGNKRRPSEYEIVTYKIHYRNRHPEAAYEQSPDSMMNKWYQKHVRDSPLKHPDWDVFRDPDQVTYRAYTTMQDASEEYVDGLIRDHAANQHDLSLDEKWVRKLLSFYTPLRYLLTAMQMASAYVVQMAPASTITACAAFQEADAFRWMSRVAYRTRELSIHYPDAGFGKKERQIWEEEPQWQGLRELVEKTLATYDWAENLFTLNVMASRAVDEVLRQLGSVARKNGDTLTAMLCSAQLKDSERSRRWTADWLILAKQQPGNEVVLQQWHAKWRPLTDRSVSEYCALLDLDSATPSDAIKQLEAFHQTLGFAA